MKLTIVTPLSKKSFGVTWVEVTTIVGNRIIQTGHTPMILILSKNRPLFFSLNNGTVEEFLIKHDAIVAITRTSLTLLLNQEL